MKKVTRDVLKDASLRLMFTMTEEQYDVLLDEFSILIQQMELIGAIPGIDDVEPMTFPFDVTVSALREDVPTNPLSQEDVVKNAGSVLNGEIKLPKVVG